MNGKDGMAEHKVRLAAVVSAPESCTGECSHMPCDVDNANPDKADKVHGRLS